MLVTKALNSLPRAFIFARTSSRADCDQRNCRRLLFSGFSRSMWFPDLRLVLKSDKEQIRTLRGLEAHGGSQGRTM